MLTHAKRNNQERQKGIKVHEIGEGSSKNFPKLRPGAQGRDKKRSARGQDLIKQTDRLKSHIDLAEF